MTRALVANLGEAFYKQVNVFTDLPKIAAPFTTIVGRGLSTDFANDCLPRLGVNRVMIQSIEEVQGEVGPNGERVFKPINDIHDQVRFVGNAANLNDNYGPRVNLSGTSTTDFLEISFYGTGLNIVADLYISTLDLRATVDGGVESANLISGALSGVTGARNYSVNQVLNVASGLTLGLHTVKLRKASSVAQEFYGYEVLNTNTTLQLVPGSSYNGARKLITPALSTTPYNSSFESGVLGTRGGHVVVYQKVDGTIGKAVTPTAATNSNFTSASHVNEEVIRVYHWREFGAGRADDFSSLSTTSSNRAFTLDDGTTTLVGSNCQTRSDTPEALCSVANGDFITITFVGTGLDIVRQDSAVGGTDTYNGSVDGNSIGSLSTTGSTVKRIEKIISGLPYGTHTFKFTRVSAATFALGIHQFIVYGPLKPSLPTGAVELTDYYLMADFVTTVADLNSIATGVLRKNPSRELTYVNGTGGTVDWALALLTTGYVSGFELSTNRQNAYFEYYFFGTGFEHRFTAGSNRSANIQVSLQAISAGGALQNLTTTNFPTITTSVYGTGVVFTASTGILDQLDAGSTAGSGFRVSTLPLGFYKVRMLNNTASSYIVMEAFDIITPVHSQKSNLPGVIQNTLPVGSQGLNDSRKFSPQLVKPLTNWAQAVGISSSPSTISNVAVPMPDMSVTIKTTGNPVQMSYSVALRNSVAGNGCQVQLTVDGVAVGQAKGIDAPVANYTEVLADTLTLPLAVGVHKIDVYWLTGAGTMVSGGVARSLTAREL